ncbi:hypothetical protein NDU88_003248 [Pleurodeles waltl]|uniref:Uncharacterized protein n=1 Tax=Pleurodeles waltl TaxID=8319 RepID=A0AAV7WU84_PLEWA|nr:hypothetical protein NDU88_003248 [Pleurodeles waltl]
MERELEQHGVGVAARPAKPHPPGTECTAATVSAAERLKPQGLCTVRGGRSPPGRPPPPIEGETRQRQRRSGGVQDSLSAHITPPYEINAPGKEPILPDTSSKKMGIENNEPLIKSIQGTEGSSGIEDSNREKREKELAPHAGNKQPQIQQSDQFEQPERQIREGTANASEPAAEREDLHKFLGSPKKWSKTTGKDPQLVDWGKNSSDKFYSLTEESDLSSGDHSFDESEGSETSEAGNISSSNEPTVQQLRRQRKSVKTRACSQEGFENSTSTGGRTLKWDYSGIELADTPTTSNQGLVNGNMETSTGAPAGN